LFSDVSRAVLLTLTNQKRSNNGIPSLKEDSKLNKAAYLKAKDMLYYDYFAHRSPSGKTPWYWLDRVGYNYQYAGENLAMDFIESKELFQAWYASSTHKANIINPKFKDIGMAVVSGNFKGRKTTVVVQYFGRRLNVSVAQARETPIKKTPQTTTSRAKEVSYPSWKTYRKTYYRKSVSTPGGMTLYEYYVKRGKGFPSVQKRAITYEKLGLGDSSSYYGSSWQNALLLNKLLSLDKKKTPTVKTKETSTEQEKKEKVLEKEVVTKEKVTEKEKSSPHIITNAKKPQEATQQKIFEKPSLIEKTKEKSNSLVIKILNFLARNYDEITRFIFISVFVIVFLSLFIDIFVKIRIQHKDIILRGTIYSFVLLALFFLDQAVILKLIPHSLGIL
jgi:hypothetical protein